MTRPRIFARLTPADVWLGGAFAIATFAVLFAAAQRCATSDLRGLACTVQDDSFYYLLPAYHLPRLGIWSFDGETQTYGFQPLFGLLLAGLSTLFDDRFTFFRGALWFAHLLHVVAAIALALLARTLARPLGAERAAMVGWMAGGLALLDHALLLSHTTLKENVLYAVLLPMALRAAITARTATGASLRPLWSLGVLAGLSLLTRLTPSSCALAIGAAWWATRERTPLVGSGPSRLRRRIAVGAGASLAVVPWLAYAHITFGRLLPTSGAVKTEWLGHAWRDGSLLARLGENLTAVPTYLADVVSHSCGFVRGLHVPQSWSDAPVGGGLTAWLIVAAALVTLFGWCFGNHLLRRVPQARLAPAMLALSLAFTALNPVLLLADRDNPLVNYAQWYAAAEPPMVILFAALAIAWLPGANQARTRRRTAPLAIAALALASAGVATAMRLRPVPFAPLESSHIHQAIVAVEATNQRLPDSARLGSWNAGAIAFFSRHRVINLDGLANDAVVGARRQGMSTLDYAMTAHVDHVLDAVVGRGWWGTNPFDRVDYLSATALHGKGFEGLYLGRLTEVRFPDYDPLRPTADVEVCLWQPNAPGGQKAAWRSVGLHRADAPVRFHTAGRWQEFRGTLRSMSGVVEVAVRLDDQVAHRIIATPAASPIAVPIHDAQVVELTTIGATTVWLHGVEFATTSTLPPPPRAGTSAYGAGYARDGTPPVLSCGPSEPGAPVTLLATGLPANATTRLALAFASDSELRDDQYRVLVELPALALLPMPRDELGSGSLSLPRPQGCPHDTVHAQLICERNGKVVATSRGLRIRLPR